MANKYYEFHYAEMDRFQIINLGVLHFTTNGKISKEDLKNFARKYLNNPAANVLISHVTKLTSAEFETATRNHLKSEFAATELATL